MKKCSRCRNQEVFEELLVCRKCKSVFFDQSDEFFVLLSLVVLPAAMFIFKGYVAPYFTYLCGTLLILALFPFLKLYQKHKYSGREVLKEVAYSLPYSLLGLLIIFVFISAITAVWSGEYVSDVLPEGDEFGLEYAKYLEISCYLIASIYVAFLMVFHRGRVYSSDRYYLRAMAAEHYALMTDYQLFTKVTSDKCTWYVGDQSYVVDRESFVVVADTAGYVYFKDRNGVYFIEHTHTERGGMILSSCDVESFVLLKEYDSNYHRAYAKDKRRVYYLFGRQSTALDELDPASVRALDCDFVCDGHYIFQYDRMITGKVDTHSLEVISDRYLKDRLGVYIIINNRAKRISVIDVDSFEILGELSGNCFYARDKQRAYYFNGAGFKTLAGVTPTDVEVLKDGFLKYREFVYRYGVLVLERPSPLVEKNLTYM